MSIRKNQYIRGMLTRQKLLWEFFCDYQDRTGTFPTFQKTAEHFGISTAAVSHRINVLKSKNLLAYVPLLGYVLLDEDGSVHHSNRSEFFRKSHLEVCLSPPVEYLNISENTAVFTLLRDFSERFYLRYGDFLVVNKVIPGMLKSGDVLVVKNKDIYSIEVYLSVPRSQEYINHQMPEYIYDARIPGNKIIGVVVGAYRDTSSGIF